MQHLYKHLHISICLVCFAEYLLKISILSVVVHQFAPVKSQALSRMAVWKKWLAKYDITETAKNTMLNEYSYLLYVGGLFLNLEPKFVIFSVIHSMVFFFNNILYMLIFSVTAAKAPTLIGLSQYLNYLTLTIISLGIYCTGLTYRSNIVRQLEIMANDFYDYGSTFVNEDEAEWKKSLKKFKIAILIAIPAYLSLIGISVLLADWIDLMFGFEVEDVDYIGAIYQRAPIKLWHPYFIDNEFKRLLAIMGQVIEAAVLSLSLGIADVMMLLLGQNVSLQMRILCTAAVKIDERALNMYREVTNGTQPSKDPIERVKDALLEKCYTRAIKQLVEHHLIIQEFYDLYNELAKWPAGFAVLNGSVMIAMTITVITTGESDRPSTYINAVLLLVAEILSMWLLCETGQQVCGWSEQLYNDLYESDWPTLGTSNKKMIMIFKERVKQPLVMMAGGLTPINRDTFGTIMNTAYSYINLLRARELK